MPVMSKWKEGRTKPGARALFAPALGALLVLLLAACGTEYPQSSLSPHTDFAEIIHGLYVNIFWWTMFIMAVVWVLLGWILIRYRAREGDEKPRQIRGHMGLEIGWTVGPALIVIAIAIPTIQAVFATQRPVADDAMIVEVTGHQFWWEFHYPEQGITTANELWLPVDQPVSLRLGSTDVIHSFWIPKLGGKRDLNPTVAVPDGQEPKYNWLFFTPLETGIFMGQCAEFCGDSHAFMAKRVIVETEENFNDWIDRWRASEGAVAAEVAPEVEETDLQVAGELPDAEEDVELLVGDEDPLVAMGRDVFLNQSTCGACHAIEGTGAPGGVGPNLTLFGERTTVAAGILENNVENVMEWIRDPWRFKPGAGMPGVEYDMEGTAAGFWPRTGLDDEQLRAVATYLLSLK